MMALVFGASPFSQFKEYTSFFHSPLIVPKRTFDENYLFRIIIFIFTKPLTSYSVLLYNACQMTKTTNKRVLVMLNQALKAARDEISGILREAASMPDIEIRVFDRNMQPSVLRERLLNWVPHGIITDNRGYVPAMLPCGKPNRAVLNLGKTYEIPIVCLDFSSANSATVGIDNEAVGRIAAEFFLRRRYRSFAFVGTNLSHTSQHSIARESAYFSAVAKAGFPYAGFELDESHSANWAVELERLKNWIMELPKPCAMLTHADVYAQLVTDACRLAKIDIPAQIALLGVDNEIDITENLRPTLSSILPDFEEGGRLALRLLNRLMKEGRRIRKPLRSSYGIKAMIERGSTHDTHGAGRLVDSARGIIRNRSREGIRVADIARELNVSPRLLELHFKQVIGRSIRDELIDQRLNEVKRLLTKTTEPIESIAIQCGWRSSIALKLLFRKRFNMSMRDYRKTNS